MASRDFCTALTLPWRAATFAQHSRCRGEPRLPRPPLPRRLARVNQNSSTASPSPNTAAEHGIAVELDGRVIGDLRAVVGDAWSQVGMEHLAKNTEAVLGWVFDPEAAGRGYATESVGALITACFALLGVRRVSGSCFAANEPSARLMKRLGMRLEEHSRKTALHRSGEWMDTMMFGVLADDWPER
ncbi:GNAT family protein [Helcobacillus sp. ACRRO]|uniref:GNAT family N-acetyltransferase n=1 Tax=Helcobacillus sp. ACRRO TaxID=2918202 RepID=UPI0031B84ED3